MASVFLSKIVLVVMLMSNCAVTAVLGIRNLETTSSKAAVTPNVPKGELDKDIIPAFVIFGDSTVDAGNNNYMATIVKSNFRPYGINFEGHVPTGRFTDGLLTTDFVCKPTTSTSD